MYFKIASNLTQNSAGTAYSQAFSMDGANAVNIANVAMQGSGYFQMQEGNDLENWNNVSTNMSFTGGTAQFNSPGTAFNVLKSTAPNVTGRYGRIVYVFGSAGVVSTDVNTSSL